MRRYSSFVVLFVFLIAFFQFPGALANPTHSDPNPGLDPVATRAWLKRRFENRKEKKEGVLISTSYRCRTSCRCIGRPLQKKGTDYVVCADSSDEAARIETARAACKSSCLLEGVADPTSPSCQPLDTQCKKAHCP
jgi:hypothetical protein